MEKQMGNDFFLFYKALGEYVWISVYEKAAGKGLIFIY